MAWKSKKKVDTLLTHVIEIKITMGLHWHAQRILFRRQKEHAKS